MNRLLKRFRMSLNWKLTSVTIMCLLIALGIISVYNQTMMRQLTLESLQTMETEFDVLVQEYYDNYISEISDNVEKDMKAIMNENQMAASFVQRTFDHQSQFVEIGKALQQSAYFKDEMTYSGKWYQNKEGEPAVVFVPGAQVNDAGQLLPGAQRLIDQTRILDFVLPSFTTHGVNKLQAYYQGNDIDGATRLVPWLNMGKTIFDVYPELNELPIWETFNPGLIAEYQAKVKALIANKQPLSNLSKASPPVQDAITGQIVLTFATPIWSNQYTTFEGAMSYDVPISSIIDRIEKIRLSKTGFAFMAQSNGNLFAVKEEGAKRLGIKSVQLSTQQAALGFNRLERFLKDSQYESVKNIPINQAGTQFTRIDIEGKAYLIITRPMKAYQTWHTDKGFYDEYWTLGFAVPVDEVYQVFSNVDQKVNEKLQSSLVNDLILTTVMVILAIFVITIINSRMTKRLNHLAVSTQSILDRDNDILLEVTSIDEIGVLSNAFNVMKTDVRESFKKLETSELKYRSLIENVSNMIYTITPKGELISVNQSLQTYFETDQEALVGQPLGMLFADPQASSDWSELIQQVCDTKKTLTVQYKDAMRPGGDKVLNVTLVPLLDKDQNVSMILGSHTDITELVQAQEEIERLHNEEKSNLEALVNEKNQAFEKLMIELSEREKLATLGGLVTGVSHEINTPLGVAITTTSYLENCNQLFFDKALKNQITQKELNEYIKNINESSNILEKSLQRAAKVVNSFKEIAVHQSVEEPMLFNMLDYLNLTLFSLQHELNSRNHDIRIECDPNLSIHSYAGAFSQMITNMVMNTLHHGIDPSKESPIVIQIGFKVEGRRATLTFADDGLGISKEHITHIFEPFYTTNRNTGGSGLGLSIVYNIVNGLLNGRISCESEIGQGTRFVIEFECDSTVESHV